MNADGNTNATTLNLYGHERRHNIIRKQRHILIIDDQSTGRVILEQIIQQVTERLHIASFATPKEALLWLEDNDPALIVTDYRMPEINGIEFIKHVREMPKFQHVPIMMITVVSEKEVRYKALEAGATAFLNRPIDQIECKTSCRNLLKMQEQNLIIQDRADWLARQVDTATAQIVAREREAILRLAKAGEYRDEGTGNHVIRMAKYAREIADATGKFNEEECETLEYAAPMHDIGKIGIPDSVLLKPGKFKPEELVIMQQHAEIGHAILSNSQSVYMQIGAVIALNHHERFDGNGYPNKLKGEKIPFIARVVAVADVFDALMSERPYKQAWSCEEALDYIKQQSGSHLDPICVQAFFDRIDNIKQIQADYKDEN